MTDHGDNNIRGLKDSGRTHCPCSIMFCCCEERKKQLHTNRKYENICLRLKYR